MKELNDTDFDKAFKTRMTEELPEFEEESWLKMEKKLRNRDRRVFLRYASILLILLSFGSVFYLLNKKSGNKNEAVIISKKVESKKNGAENEIPSVKPTSKEISANNNKAQSNSYQTPHLVNQDFKIARLYIAPSKIEKSIITGNILTQNSLNTSSTKVDEVISATPSQAVLQPKQDVIVTADPLANSVDLKKGKSDPETKIKVKRRIPMSVAIIAGPDFSSTNSLIGGKTGVTIGVAVGVGLTKKLSVQTGISYGSKNYSTSAYDYTFSNPGANKANFSSIDAACEVIEIPLRASYNISENKKRSIELNAGLSSYLMVKENYIFKYNQALNRADRVTDISNKNKHILSVIDLSATYNIKLKNKNFAFGIEPYVKIPLTGIGEGSVPLKSSGVSLKLRYDFNKK